ncbi:hypothetical protein [Prosthecobacter sp.]|jgi:hypothetical protein|uniref:hypothetical protein n=1 Tax=Prosthecobacter sp. TaxID=1965333 RepID=UPI003783E6E7
MRKLLRVVPMMAACGLLSGCELLRENKVLITCHVQTNAIEHPAEIMRLPIGGQEITFKKVPEFSQRSIAAFQPFPADDGQGNGLLLQLDAKGKNYLEAASRLNQGMVILTMINAVPVDMVELDQPITDGRFTIWRGVSDETIKELDKFYPRIDRLKSSSRWMDMLPSTDKEKLNARRVAKEAEAAEKAAQRDLERGITRPAPKTRDIPLEGFKMPGTR